MSFQLVINGSVFSVQAYGGISNIFRHVLPRICQQDPSVKVTLFVKSQSKSSSLPQHKNIRIVKTPAWLEKRQAGFGPLILPSYLELFKRLSVGPTNGKILHPTYYDLIPGWHGPKVITVYDMIYEKWPNWFQDSEWVIKSKERAIRIADSIFCISESTRQDLLTCYRWLDPKKTCVIHLSHHPIFTPRTEFLVEKVDFPFILYVGSRNHRKGTDDLLHAYAAWHKKEEVRLLFVGREWSPREVEQLNDLGIAGQVILKSNIPDDGLCDLYNQASAFVYPSLYEGFGIPLLEAMACNCPVVASRIPTSIEVAGEIPYFFDPGNQDGLLDAMETAVNATKQNVKIQAGMERAHKYSWDKTANEMLKAYRYLI